MRRSDDSNAPALPRSTCDHGPVRTSIAIALLLMATACGPTVVDVTKPSGQVIFSTNAQAPSTLNVGVADTPEERQQGLSGVTSLPQDYGMAFLYTQPTADEFWMKDTLVPLSIAFVSSGGTIMAIREMTPCLTEPCRMYVSPGPYTLAIEANPRWFVSNRIRVGDSAAMAAIP